MITNTKEIVIAESVQPDMGNELSHSDGVKQSVGGEGSVGHFHKVLVEPDSTSGTSLPELELPDGNFVVTRPGDGIAGDQQENSSDTGKPTNSEYNIHEQDTLKIRGTPDDNADDRKDTAVAKNSDDDEALFEECKALISEAADRAVKRSLSKPTKPDIVTDLDASSVDDNFERPEVIEQRKSGITQSVEDLTTFRADPVGESSSTNKTNTFGNSVDVNFKSSFDDVSELEKQTADELLETIHNGADKNIEHEYTSKDKKGKKNKPKSKNKRNDNKDIQIEEIESTESELNQTDETDKSENTLEKKTTKGNIFANMFKFSRRKDKTVKVSDADKSGTEASIATDHGSEALVKPSTSFEAINHDVAEVKRLNSLDSGIGVEKVSEQPPVEYAVVQKKRSASNDDNDRNGSIAGERSTDKVASDEIVVNPAIGQRLAEPIYINGEKTDEDFVYINERAIDIEGLVKPEDAIVAKALPVIVDCADGDKMNGEKRPYDEEMESNISSDSGTVMGTKAKTIDKEKPDKAKLKKKSWSFQVGKKKQNAEKDTVAEANMVSMDPGASSKEPKKPRWRFGKFSFRKSQPDMSKSTPNLTNAGIPEENENLDGTISTPERQDKKKSKLKLLKSKKDKKIDTSTEEVTSEGERTLEKRSSSLMNIILGDSAPRNRKSIVEEDPSLHQTDAFEGVSLSDLSLEGDVTEPKTADSRKEQKDKKKKKSSKKDKDGKKSNKKSKGKSSVKDKDKNAKPLETETEITDAPTTEQTTLKLNANTDLQTESGVPNPPNSPVPELNHDAPDVSVSLSAEEPQLYTNQADTVKSEDSTPDDEYVNIVNAVKEIAEHNLKEAERESEADVAHQTVGDTEYAIVAKRNEASESTPKDGEESSKNANIEAEAGIADAPKIANLTENAFESSTEDDIGSRSEVIEDERKDIESNVDIGPIEPPSDFKDGDEVDSEAKEETIVPEQQERAFCNLIYSDEAFQQVVANIQQKTDEHKPKVDIEPTVEDSESLEAVAVETEPAQNKLTSGEIDDDADAYVQLKEVIPELSASTKASNTNADNSLTDNQITASAQVHSDANINVEKADKLDSEITLAPVDFATPEENIVIVDLEPLKVNNLESCHETSTNDHHTDTDENTDSGNMREIKACEIKPLVVEIVEKSINQLKESERYDDDENNKSKVNAKKVLIMKDVGVQAPDIYIPLDIEKDFGFSRINVSRENKGVQVCTEDLGVDHVVVLGNTAAGLVAQKTNEKPTSPAGEEITTFF